MILELPENSNLLEVNFPIWLLEVGWKYLEVLGSLRKVGEVLIG
jgi:hypothetical protein